MNTYIESYLDSTNTNNTNNTNTNNNTTNNNNRNNNSHTNTKLRTSEYNKLLMLKNKKPVWDANHGGHVLNFHGRVTKSSVKNFQLCIEKNWYSNNSNNNNNNNNGNNGNNGNSSDDDEEYINSPMNPYHQYDVILQFGKIATDKFTMDVQYPLSVYQAYAICIACMDGKLADRRGYEYMKKLTGMSGSGSGSGAGSASGSGGNSDGADEKVCI